MTIFDRIGSLADRLRTRFGRDWGVCRICGSPTKSHRVGNGLQCHRCYIDGRQVLATDGGRPADHREDPEACTIIPPTRVREHYAQVAPVARALGGLEAGGHAGGNADFSGWYRSLRPTPERSDEHDGIARGWILDEDYSRLQGALDRVLYATTSYADRDAHRWRPFVWGGGDTGRGWKNDENPLPGYGDLAAYAPFADIDLADEIKHQRPTGDIPLKAVEAALSQYIEAFADLAGSRDAVYVLDSVGGAYVFVAPGATAPIAEYYDDPVARGRVFSELCSRLNGFRRTLVGLKRGVSKQKGDRREFQTNPRGVEARRNRRES